MDIHGNQDLFDSLEKAQGEKEKNEALRFAETAKEYALQGFDEHQVSELLEIDGCSKEVAKNVAISACYDIPNKYASNEKPANYNDVRSVVEHTILNGDIQQISSYVDKFAKRAHSDICSRILMARDNPSRIFIEEVHSEIRPLIEGIIIENNVMAENNKRVASSLNDKERLELDLFGIWPIYYIQKQARKQEAERDILDNHIEL